MLRFFTNTRLKAWLLFFTLPLILISCGRSNDENLFNVQGTWYIYSTGERDENNVPKALLFAFSQSKQDITGTTPLGFSLSGSTSDVNISFSWVGKDVQNNTVSYYYNGTIYVIATMSGTWTSGSGKSGIWQAIVNTAPLVTLEDTFWKISYATNATNGVPGATGSNTFHLRQNNKQNNTSLAGSTFGGIIGTGSVTAVTVLFTWVQDGTTYFYTGTVSNGNSMTGTWLTDKGQSGTWSGTLTPKPAS